MPSGKRTLLDILPAATLGVAVALALVLVLVNVSGCARTAEERQLDEMRDEIDRIQQARDREDEKTLPLDAAESNPASSSLFARVARVEPAPTVEPLPADQDSVTLGGANASPTGGPGSDEDWLDGYADTEDPAPRPNLRVFGSARGSSRGAWRADDQVEQTFPDDGVASVRPGSPLDPAAAVAYDAAMALVNARQFDRALEAFAAFLVKWPDHPYANNAMYWRGECYFAKGEYGRSAEQFEGVVARFPAGSKAPDALLKLGMAHQKLGEPFKAKEAFDRLAQLYPQSDAARRIPPVTISATTPRGPTSEDHR